MSASRSGHPAGPNLSPSAVLLVPVVGVSYQLRTSRPRWCAMLPTLFVLSYLVQVAFGLHTDARTIPKETNTITVGVFDEDGRRIRDRTKDPELERAQGRVHCLDMPLKRNKNAGSLTNREKDLIRRNGGATSWLAISNDVIVLSRHVLIDSDAKSPKVDPRNCYFEHIDSGEMIKFADVEIAATKLSQTNSEKLNTILWFEGDYAMARLTKSPTGGAGIPRNRIVVRRDLSVLEEIRVIANHANNNASGNEDELTEVYCRSERHLARQKGVPSSLYIVTCAGGPGSSGSAVIDVSGRIWGVLTGSYSKSVADRDLVPSDLLKKSLVTGFDYRIFEMYERLEARRVK